jgi:transposase
MTQIDLIKKAYFEEGLNVSELAERFNHDRKTIRKYLNKEDWNKQAPTGVQIEKTFVKLEPYKKDINQWLEEDKRARRKQRHTAKRVYDRLRKKYEDQFDCSYRTVAGYVANKKKELFKNNTCYLPLQHIPGEAQVDFGDADFHEIGTKYSGSYLNLSFPTSNAGYLQLFKGENQECLFEGLKNIFEHIGGVPHRIWFDNASTMVKDILKEGNRNLTDGFIRFKSHYSFDAAFCNPYSGHEKGHIESKVGYHRRNLLVPIPSFEDLKTFNKKLLIDCDEDTEREHYRKEIEIAELFQDDKKALLALPAVPYEACQYLTLRTNLNARFSLQNGKHLYSTAPKYANSRILVKITAYEVIPLDENHRPITRHQRLYGDRNQEKMDWIPYLTQLARSPGALKYSGIYSMLPDPLQTYLDRISKSERGKILRALANLCENSSFEQAVMTVEHALNHGVKDLDSLVALHQRLNNVVPPLPNVHLPEGLPRLATFHFDAKAYDAALHGGKGGEKGC